MIPTLPSNDPDPSGRADALAVARSELVYAYDRPRDVAMAASVPKRLGFPLGVIAQVAGAEARLTANSAGARLREGLRGLSDDAPTSLAACTALFAAIELPPVARLLDEGRAPSELFDRVFAWQRLAGANPFTLARVDAVPFDLQLDAAARALPSDTLEAAAEEGRLFASDYSMLEGIPAGEGRSLRAPIALFVRPKGSRSLAPVAIQLERGGASGPRAVTPQDGVAWRMASVAVQVADANVEESFFHLGRAHFLVEAFAMALERQVSSRHPLSILLAPHFFGTIAINGSARDELVVPGGQLDELLGATLEGSLDLVRRGLSSFRLDEHAFELDLARRGLDDATLEFPYRDDGRLVADAIEGFARDYLALYYADDTAVAADTELQAFVRELGSAEGGRLRGVPSALSTRASLEALVRFIMFQTSAFHAALNYTQADFMGWVPNMPASAHAPPLVPGDPASAEEAWAAVLPAHALAQKQLAFMWQQSQVRDNRLGDYPRSHFADARVAEPLALFRSRLDEADRCIAARDAERLLPYPYLRPSLLTASIHI